jgi:hypothetical protein
VNAVVAPVDFTHGFPGKLPQAKTQAEQSKLLKFFELYVRCGNAREAALQAKYSKAWAQNQSYAYLKRYADYVTWLQAHYAQAAVKAAALDDERILEELQAIGLANDWDYLVIDRSTDPPAVRRKRLDELTREQMRAIEVYERRGKKGTIELAYTFRDRDGKLAELARATGLLNEKVILEHRHRHLHVVTDLSRVPLEKLEAMEREFQAMLTQTAAGQDVPR